MRSLVLKIASFVALVVLCSCSEGGSFVVFETELFGTTAITEAMSKTIILGNSSETEEQHIRAIAFDRGSNAAGHFRIDGMSVGGQLVESSDIVIPPGSSLQVIVTYAPMDLDPSTAAYGGWVTGDNERWIPKHPDEVDQEEGGPIYHRAILEAVYDYPKEGIFYVQLVGDAEEGPDGEEQAGGAFATCIPGGGTACFTGGIALDLPQLVTGGPKDLEITGPIRLSMSGGEVSLRMDDFPYAIMYLRSEEIPQLPSGVTATMVISGATGVEATGTFDGTRIALDGVGFRIRVALGELGVEQIKQGISAMVDFELDDLTLETVQPLAQGMITMKIETTIPENPSGNELFDQFLSGVSVIVIMEGELAF